METNAKLISRKEAASRLGIGLRTLDRRLATGELQCYRLGTGPKAPVRISEEHLRDFLSATQSLRKDEAVAIAHSMICTHTGKP
jgi:excisionase family DNA binding protein